MVTKMNHDSQCQHRDYHQQSDLAGATSDESSQRPSSSHNRHSLTKGRESSAGNATNKDLDRAKLVRDRQNEERQRKLEELRQQALAAQRFREQREEERRRRIEELRTRDNDRRSQVEERKRQIWEAERERREAIMRKSQEREARIEAKRKNERSHIVFAFGSSTPRMLEPADTGGAAASFWGTRRATSTSNVMMSSFTSSSSGAQPLTRRSSERELDAGSKKRATSAGGLDRKPGEGDDSEASLGGATTPTSSSSLGAGCVTRYANRRRTDLMPTIPSPRDSEARSNIGSHSSSINPLGSGRSSSAKSFTRSPGIRSGEVTPSSPSRPHSSMSQQSGTSSVTSVTSGIGGTVTLRPRSTGTPRRPRPASIAGTGVSTSFDRNNLTGDSKPSQKDAKPPLPAKVHSSMSTSMTGSISKKSTNSPGQISAAMIKSASLDRKSSGAGSRSGRPSPRVTPKPTPLQSPGFEQLPPPQLELVNVHSVKEQHNSNSSKTSSVKEEERKPEIVKDDKPQIVQETSASIESTTNESKKPEDNSSVPESKPVAMPASDPPTQEHAPTSAPVEQLQETSPPMVVGVDKKEDAAKCLEKKSPEPETKQSDAELEEVCDMTASMIQKIRITTEEEAKAALAERRRLAREQAEREAELEKQRLEEEARLEAERLRAEEEEQRRLEEETLRLAQEAREAEEQRLKQAIEEAKRREEEDRKRREEEARQKAEKEEAERKAKIEAEKQRDEMEQRLKKEEEERNARRKRVEAIMSRTRKSQANAQKGEGNDGEKSKEDSPSDESKPGPGEKSAAHDLMTTSLITEATQQFITSEQRSHSNSTSPVNESNNGLLLLHSNGTSHSNGIAGIDNNSTSNNKSLLDNDNSTTQQQQQEFNGHHNNSTSHGNGIDGQTIALDNATVKQNNVTNNLLDLSEFDELSNSNSMPILLMPQPQQQQQQPNEDSINSNLNPTAMPFMPSFGITSPVNANNPFQDPFASNKQQDNQVTDLLS